MLIVQATIALMKDGTIAVEVNTSLTLIQWPFLTDISLAWAAASIFDPSLVENDADGSAMRTEIDAVLAHSEVTPWLYFNCVLRDSQMFLPVADPFSLCLCGIYRCAQARSQICHSCPRN